MIGSDWKDRLSAIHAEACQRYAEGWTIPADTIPDADLPFLEDLGLTRQIVFDFVEDRVTRGEPDLATLLDVSEIRRDVFQASGGLKREIVPESALPLRSDEWDGIPWLPRIYTKARCFLDGTLSPEVMYGCGGDRAFLVKHSLTLAGFLAAVRDGDEASVLEFVKTGQPAR